MMGSPVVVRSPPPLPSTSALSPRPQVQKKPVEQVLETAQVSETNQTPLAPHQANSGLQFLRQLVQPMDPNKLPLLRPTAWNIGSRNLNISSRSFIPSSIIEVLSVEQMRLLADVYFRKVHPSYCFLRRDRLFHQIDERWMLKGELPDLSSPPQAYDAVLCGVAALGSYFSKANALPSGESHLIQLGQSILDMTASAYALGPDIISGWVCRVIYLRMASEPLNVWLACCTTMNLLEAYQLHLRADADDAKDVSFPASNMSRTTCELLESSYEIVQHLGTWTAYELGMLQFHTGFKIIQPSYRSSDYINKAVSPGQKIMSLLPASLELIREQDNKTLRQTLLDLVQTKDLEPTVVMAQGNLILCIVRRLWSRGGFHKDGDQLLSKTLASLRRCFAAARQMIADDCPWHHLAYVPFQIICILLAIDSHASLQMLAEAVETLKSVVLAYETRTIKEAYETVRKILRLHQQRRADDLRIFTEVLTASDPAAAETTKSYYSSRPSEVNELPSFESWSDGLLRWEHMNLSNFFSDPSFTILSQL
ncbi:Protein RDR1 [Trichoderma lentiforme]|uniref:Protein RDR1 n=1 Tax=Trichoderma lentiforme TaxID=1567552 RepID=A0A9P4X360_9HYPO|nr:Protein RDR1 [Trichoderma lentiforme]